MKKLFLILAVVLSSLPAYATSTLYSNSTTGFVGIGTSSPAGTLDVEGGTAAASTNGNPIELVAQNGGTGNQNGGNIILMPGTATGTGTPGYVGIGTSSPNVPLDVIGNTSIIGTALNVANSANLGLGLINTATNGVGWYFISDTSGNFTFWNSTKGLYPFFINGTNSNIGISNLAPAYLLHVGSSSASGTVMELQNSSGGCTYTPSASSVTVSCSSDRSLKTDIQDSHGALTWVDAMRIRDFTIKATGEHRTGVIAQEVMQGYPDMVHKDGKSGLYSVDEPNPWVLVKSIQELHTVIQAQQTEIDALKQEIAQIKQSR